MFPLAVAEVKSVKRKRSLRGSARPTMTKRKGLVLLSNPPLTVIIYMIYCVKHH